MQEIKPRAVFKSLAILLCFAVGCFYPQMARPVDAVDADEYKKLWILSGQMLNLNTGLQEDSLLHLARRVEAHARAAQNLKYEFKAGQIQVNTYGLQGSFGLAVNKAQQLLERAHDEQDPLAVGIAIQAIGDNYMHTARYTQADSIFTEAISYMEKGEDAMIRVQLMLQHLHLFFVMQDTNRLRSGIDQVGSLLKQSGGSLYGVESYYSLLNFYEISHAIQTKNDDRLRMLVTQVDEDKLHVGIGEVWYHDLLTRYYMFRGDVDSALFFSDRTMQFAELEPNKNILRQVLLQRAMVLETIGQQDKACLVYKQTLDLIDSLHRTSYMAQIDSLHVSYWIDHLQMDNLIRRNDFFVKLAGVLALVLLITAFVVFHIRRKNRQIEASRLRLEAMREASADSIRSKSLFLSNMSHELRTPLNAITGFSEILTENEEMDAETQHEYYGYIRQNADLLMKLINDVSDFSGLKGESIRFAFETCDVVALCRNVLQTVENIKRTEATLHFVTSLEQLNVMADKNRLQQVLINLLVNATKFTKHGTITLRLEVDEQHDQALFTVEDTGCGIPPEKQARIFERFEKLHEGVQGAGLGLSICKLIVDHVGGSIWIDPEYTQGARFVFTHPLHFKPQQTDNK